MRNALTIDIDPMLLHLGPFAISWYGMAVGAAILAGVWLALREARRKGLSVDAVATVTLWTVAGGFVGARLLHVIDRWDFYAADPARILAFQNGGLAIVGALLGGTLAGALAAWRLGLPVMRVSDAAAPGVVLGQAIGRLGCLVTGDALGRATGGWWGVAYLNPRAMAPELGVAYEPVFAFEMLWDLALFALLLALRRRVQRDGQLFALYLGLYAVGKFGLTFLRTESVWFWGLQEAQLLALASLGVALIWGGLGARLGAATARRI